MNTLITHHNCTTLRSAGFSLIELAITISIIALLVASALTGQTLIKNATLKSIISEVDNHKLVIEQFTMQYDALPGDLSNAETFFGASETDNGDDNNQIAAATEQFAAWDQLTLAKLMPGSFTGVTGSGGGILDGAVISGATQNVPNSKQMETSGYSLAYIAAPASWQDALGRNFPGNYLIFAKNTTSDNILAGATLIPEDAFYIDSKADDGQPDFGKILSNGTNCTTANAPTDADYNFSATVANCLLYFNIEN